jgi:hypothetical protein
LSLLSQTACFEADYTLTVLTVIDDYFLCFNFWTFHGPSSVFYSYESAWQSPCLGYFLMHLSPRDKISARLYLRDALDNSRKAWEIRPRFTTDDQQTCRFDSPIA